MPINNETENLNKLLNDISNHYNKVYKDFREATDEESSLILADMMKQLSAQYGEIENKRDIILLS